MEQGQEPVAAEQPASGTQAESQQQNGTVGKVEELPQWAQELVKGLRSEAAANRKAKSDAEKAAQAAREKELAEQNAWKELAEQRQQQLAKLESQAASADSLTEKLTKYEALLSTTVKAQLDKVPEPFKPLLAKLDIIEQMEWIATNGEKLGTVAGVPPTPRASGAMSETNREEARKAQERFTRSIF